MPLQKRRMGPARIHRRRSAWMRGAASHPQIQTCSNCGSAKAGHRVCQGCGYYGGKEVIKDTAE